MLKTGIPMNMNFLIVFTACHGKECSHRRVFDNGHPIPFELTPTPPGFEPVTGMLSAMMERPLQPPAFTNPEAGSLDSFEFAWLGMPPSEITLAELLADHGYHTAHIGKWHLGEENGMAPHDQGFAESI